MALNILHLSDIHFKCQLDGTIHDLDHDVRNELEIDLVQVLKDSGPIDAIVVTGDVAFGGKSEDYEVARKWLASLCEKTGCQTEQVWVVPGNHDIDWDRVTEVVRTLQDSIQNSQLDDIDRCIREFVHDDQNGAEVLASPLSEYYKFSALYGCKPKDGHLTWQDELALNAGYNLRLIGLNSAFISNNMDHRINRPLVVGQAQLYMPRKLGRVYVSLCHHPVSWLKDGKLVSDKLMKRASLQLFGHVHEQALRQTDNSLVVQAGALQPDRDEDGFWCPAYNVLTMEITDCDEGHALSVTVYPRAWCTDHCFGPDPAVGEEHCQRYVLLIDQAVSLQQVPCEVRGVTDSETDIDSEGPIEGNANMVSPIRQLVYAFLTLPYSSQVRIANRLSLLTDEDAGVDCATLFERLYQRAATQNALAALWDQVSEAQQEVSMMDNPYISPNAQEETDRG